jgi:hypothetical protein
MGSPQSRIVNAVASRPPSPGAALVYRPLTKMGWDVFRLPTYWVSRKHVEGCVVRATLKSLALVVALLAGGTSLAIASALMTSAFRPVISVFSRIVQINTTKRRDPSPQPRSNYWIELIPVEPDSRRSRNGPNGSVGY